jgi:hypothetical protein
MRSWRRTDGHAVERSPIPSEMKPDMPVPRRRHQRAHARTTQPQIPTLRSGLPASADLGP